MPGLRDQLVRFLSVPGVRAAVLAARDGLTLDAAGQGEGRHFEALAAYGVGALTTAEALGQDLPFGPTIGLVLEYDAALVSVDPLGEYAVLVTLCESAAGLTRLRQTLHAARADLLRALDERP
jgi:predicted regulator of Ras-like GTPase activity (Roadblock/LC7/MglB family)